LLKVIIVEVAQLAYKIFGEQLNYLLLAIAKQTPGNRIAPAKQDKNDAKAQMRLDAGEEEECLPSGKLTGKE